MNNTLGSCVESSKIVKQQFPIWTGKKKDLREPILECRGLDLFSCIHLHVPIAILFEHHDATYIIYTTQTMTFFSVIMGWSTYGFKSKLHTWESHLPYSMHLSHIWV